MCGATLSLEEFNKDGDGLRRECKKCSKVLKSKWLHAEPGTVNTQTAARIEAAFALQQRVTELKQGVKVGQMLQVDAERQGKVIAKYPRFVVVQFKVGRELIRECFLWIDL
jgi:hypothetical protein